MNKRAAKLLELLEEHVDVQWHHDQHLMKAVNGAYGNMKLETEAMYAVSRLQKNLMFDCEVAGFEYATLLDIIPPPFKTTHATRISLLEDLEKYAEQEF